MRYHLLPAVFLMLSAFSMTRASDLKVPGDLKSNHFFARIDYHLLTRGSYGTYSSPEFSIGYDRRLIGTDMIRFYGGLRAGIYSEVPLTGWDFNETFFHPFAGVSPSVSIAALEMLTFQVSGTWEIIFETHDDIDDFWWWSFGGEVSAQYYIKDNLFISAGGSIGIFPWFEPAVTYVRPFVKAGICF